MLLNFIHNFSAHQIVIIDTDFEVVLEHDAGYHIDRVIDVYEARRSKFIEKNLALYFIYSQMRTNANDIFERANNLYKGSLKFPPYYDKTLIELKKYLLWT